MACKNRISKVTLIGETKKLALLHSNGVEHLKIKRKGKTQTPHSNPQQNIIHKINSHTVNSQNIKSVTSSTQSHKTNLSNANGNCVALPNNTNANKYISVIVPQILTRNKHFSHKKKHKKTDRFEKWKKSERFDKDKFDKLNSAPFSHLSNLEKIDMHTKRLIEEGMEHSILEIPPNTYISYRNSHPRPSNSQSPQQHNNAHSKAQAQSSLAFSLQLPRLAQTTQQNHQSTNHPHTNTNINTNNPTHTNKLNPLSQLTTHPLLNTNTYTHTNTCTQNHIHNSNNHNNHHHLPNHALNYHHPNNASNGSKGNNTQIKTHYHYPHSQFESFFNTRSPPSNYNPPLLRGFTMATENHTNTPQTHLTYYPQSHPNSTLTATAAIQSRAEYEKQIQHRGNISHKPVSQMHPNKFNHKNERVATCVFEMQNIKAKHANGGSMTNVLPDSKQDLAQSEKETNDTSTAVSCITPGVSTNVSLIQAGFPFSKSANQTPDLFNQNQICSEKPSANNSFLKGEGIIANSSHTNSKNGYNSQKTNSTTRGREREKETVCVTVPSVNPINSVNNVNVCGNLKDPNKYELEKFDKLKFNKTSIKDSLILNQLLNTLFKYVISRAHEIRNLHSILDFKTQRVYSMIFFIYLDQNSKNHCKQIVL